MIQVKTKREIDHIRESSHIVAEVLDLVGRMVKPGVTTGELNEAAEEHIRSRGGTPAFKGYGPRDNPFPAALCTSVDSEVVHGIPGGRVLNEGEILSVDVGVKKNGYHGDGARSFRVGALPPEKDRLVKVTEEALAKGIEQAKAGNHVEDISSAIQQHVETNGFSVVRDLVGHGVGKKLHEEPSVPNFGERGKGDVLRNGMTLAIEPMVNAGSWEVRFLSDGWTVVTLDGKPSAHFEHTIAIVNGNPEILTR
ncbi:MAG: type I methionyl aminopeptidase [Ignavibacteriales bacterium]|nr:type I methionyl aminopeptidase [Ignavibacteriales bacterium]